MQLENIQIYIYLYFNNIFKRVLIPANIEENWNFKTYIPQERIKTVYYTYFMNWLEGIK